MKAPAARVRAGRPGFGWTEEAGRRALALSPAARQGLRTILWDDLASEYDARFYSAWIEGLDRTFTPEFWEVHEAWREDEDRHHAWIRAAWTAAFGWDGEVEARLEARRPDFGPIAHLFEDEFAIACLGCYDELATVRAYRKSLPVYGLLGPGYRAVVGRIIADEALHYRNYLDLIGRRHRHRLHEAEAVVGRIRAAEGTPYRATFVLDHDDAVWDEGIFDEAARILLEQLRRLRETGAPG